MRREFAQARRAGYDIEGLSAKELVVVMVDILRKLPPGAAPSKSLVVQRLGLLGAASKTRDIDAAWNRAKRQVVREHPEKFCFVGKALRWTADAEARPLAKLSAAGHRRLAALAANEGMTPDDLLACLFAYWHGKA